MPTTVYTLADGTRVPGTTTITSRFKDSGGLMFWAFNQGKSGAERLYDAAEKAADIGTLAHAMIETHINGGHPGDVEIKATLEMYGKARNAFNQYLAWESNSSIRLLSKFQEIHLVSEKHKFGGTPDAIGMIGNELVLLDWKTSNKTYPDFLLQLAAYRHLVEEGERLDTRTRLNVGEVQGFHLLRIAKDYPDFEHRYFGELDEAWTQFLLLRAAYDLDKKLKARVK